MRNATIAFEDRSRWGRLLGAGIWLLFLGNPLQRLLDERDDVTRIGGVVALGLFIVVYLVGLTQVGRVHAERRYAAARAAVVTMLVLTAAVVPGAGDQALTCLVFVAALAVATLPSWQALAVVAALFATTSVVPLVVDGWLSHGNNFAVILASAAVWSFRLAWQRQARLIEAERDLSELAVEEERDRIGRDLHDILGHSLTIIAVKAELAERLLESDPERARAELIDLQRLSRDALADVRSTARGIRGISLPGEIASARMALESAGIEPLLPTVADDVPTRWRELFAWTLREGVTNVIRHSEASRCVVEVAADRISVVDDGLGRRDADDTGSGLEGLRQRARLVGATVTTAPGPEQRGFALTVSVPA